MQLRRRAWKTRVLGCLADRSDDLSVQILLKESEFLFVFINPLLISRRKNHIPTHPSPYIDVPIYTSAGAHKRVAPSTHALIAEERFVYGGRVSARLLHAL